MSQNIILNHQEIEHKTKRIAYQIYETFVDEKEIVIAGIASNGYVFAQKIAQMLREISTLQVLLCEVTINKIAPNENITTSIPANEYQNKGIVLVDDVLNSGTTLVLSLIHI
jgi:pyrimidine operon attenuation protein/uracil phosphoribosyltransferase